MRKLDLTKLDESPPSCYIKQGGQYVPIQDTYMKTEKGWLKMTNWLWFFIYSMHVEK